MKRPRLASAVLASALGVGIIGGALATPGTARPVGDMRPGSIPDPPRKIGAGSCAAKGCHGGVGAADPTRGDVAFTGGEFTTWKTFDPHARAFSVLLGDRSSKIADRLKGQLQGRRAHEAPACLACHAPDAPSSFPPEPAARLANLRAGVDCETCHGPASSWKDAHLSAAWRSLGPDAKAEAGMVDLGGPLARARSCVGCHVGDPSRGMDVNHDLIAAGHPRLNFEFASYLAAYPKHWREPGGFDEAKAWAVGQAVVAKAAVDLLAGRARGAVDDGPAPWPEFSEFACFSCHRELPSTVGGPPGAARPAGSPLPWATWPLAMLPAIAEGRSGADLAALRLAMTRDEPNPADVARLADGCSRSLADLASGLDSGPFDDRRAIGLMAALSKGGGAGRDEEWDAAVQRLLGLAALARARAVPNSPAIPPGVRRALETAPKLLAFPPGFDGPRRDRSPTSTHGAGEKPR